MASPSAFMAAYQAYESAVREVRGKECREHEADADGVASERLRICRQVRNYLAHANDRGFVAPSDAMVRFLEEEAMRVRGEADVARKHVARGCVMAPSTRVDTAVQQMAKSGSAYCAVEAKGGGAPYRLVTLADAACAALSSKTTKLDAVKGSRKAAVVDELADVAGIERGTMAVVEGKRGALGVLRW